MQDGGVNDSQKAQPTTPHLIPDVEPLPDALFGGAEALEDESDFDSFWSSLFPQDLPFFKLSLLAQLARRPYHAVTVEGPFDLPRLAQECRTQLFRTETILSRKGKPQIERLLLACGEGVFGYYEGECLQVYAPTPQSAAAAAQGFRRFVKPLKEDKPRFFVISLTPEGPVAESVVVERAAPISAEDLALNYGDGFVEWEQAWLGRVRKNPSGVTILHGPPGTGKTSFLRALMNRLLGQAVFYYVPTSEAEMLSSPRFVNFWVSQTRRQKGKTKIAILEDAEELLLPRDAGSREKVSNLLNISDGLLGDHLKLHVIATTNIHLGSLDPAIVRPGRLVGAREFRRLNRAEASRLAAAKALPLPETDDVSLAELYCGGSTSLLAKGRRIGFS